MTISPGTITAVLATALAMSTVRGAQAQTGDAVGRSSPVKVTSCKVISQPLSAEEVDRASDIVAGRLWFSLTNEWPEPATEVKFRVQYGAFQATVVDTGFFSQGVRIEGTSDVTVFSPWVGIDPQACTVVSVKFANGTAWMPPTEAAESAG